MLLAAITLLAAGDSIWESQVWMMRKCDVAACDFADVLRSGSRKKCCDCESEDVAELGKCGAVRDRRVFENGEPSSYQSDNSFGSPNSGIHLFAHSGLSSTADRYEEGREFSTALCNCGCGVRRFECVAVIGF